MVVLLVAFLAVIVCLAFLIGNNLSNLTSFWFFHTYTEVPVLMLVFISFAAGILFSILVFSYGKLKKFSQENDEKAEEQASQKAEKIKNKIKNGRKERKVENKDVIVEGEKSDN